MNYTYFVGIDVSKLSFDAAIVRKQDAALVVHKAFSNTVEGIHDLFDFLNKEFPGFTIHGALFCMEATGVYCTPLLNFLQENNAHTWVENSVRIKRSQGIARGKNDAVDAKRIADYALRNADKARLWNPSSHTLEQIKHLAALRDRMVITQKRLLSPINEFKDMGQQQMASMLEKSIKKTLAAIDQDINKIEAQIMECLKQDESLHHLFTIVKSVVGIGLVTTVNLLIHTNGFTIMNDGRKLACYCGVAPFPYQSGTSIKGKTKVHHMANKKLKTNLHMASLTAVKLDPDLKNYYERKVAEGKSKMSVLNAVKCKLLTRIVACVNNNKEYVKKTA